MREFSQQRGTLAILSSLGSPARQSYRMTTQRNRHNTFGKNMPHSRQYESRLRVTPWARECLERLEAILVSRQYDAATCPEIREDGQLPRDVRGSSGPLLGVPEVGV